MIRVYNLLHKNQFVIEDNRDVYFQSYQSIIAKIDYDCDLTIYENYNYSATTSKHLKIFLENYMWNNSAVFDELIKKKSVSKSLDIMMKKGLIIKGW